jgi:hypothetical protein
VRVVMLRLVVRVVLRGRRLTAGPVA